VATLFAVGLTGVATVVGLVMVWPDGSGREAAQAGADEIGLLTQQLAATVETVEDGLCSYSTPDNRQNCRTITFTVHEGPEPGALVVLPEFNLDQVTQAPDLAVGDEVILGYEDSTNFYFYIDRQRSGLLLWLGLAFGLVVVALARIRGLLALAAMALTLAVLVGFVAPSVIDGNDPLVVSVLAASLIAFVSLYLTHGFSPTTTVALAGTLGALGLTLAISWFCFGLARFTGYQTETGILLPLIADIDVSSLLLGGAVLGALGALDDVTVTQVATVAELRRTNASLSVAQLVASGIRVGREHIASAVNTLLLAYAGAGMPLLLLFAASDQPLARVANGEVVALEIVRTLCGSIGLVAAVPVTTFLAAILVVSDPADDEVAAVGPATDDLTARPGDASGSTAGGSPGESTAGDFLAGGGSDRHPPPPAHRDAPASRQPIEPVPAPRPMRPATSWDQFGPEDGTSW
jgi:uncharacterized membrane protein